VNELIWGRENLKETADETFSKRLQGFSLSPNLLKLSAMTNKILLLANLI
jgi:hypothetical protein